MSEPFDFDAALQDGLVPADLRALGWRYFDPPTKFSHEMWDRFRGLIGMEEHKLLIYSEGTAPDGFEWKRGQFIISPQGMKNLANRTAATPSPANRGGEQ